MFADRFYGGPHDGEVMESSADTASEDRIKVKATGTFYVRAPELDTPAERAWKLDTEPDETPSGEPARPGVGFHYENPAGITLDDLKRFVAVAEDNGWPPGTQVRVVAKFNGKLRRVEVR
ncbi:hypothetical protein [Nesterenkonia rhizosphaerae]|uniref:Uncharacterized protein n=1 Tax=Nesterenkonia rhizosphaerae TaxID=1348272 RepID=A0ABP9FTJ4_9MICC